ncbi:hypothetical protein HKX48_008400 [Thoreauomyces humboldtii]|nr:hypothetical protein HKX48_008400 [Thoreauomyces humboldtii]
MASPVGQLSPEDVGFWAQSHANSTVKLYGEKLQEWGVTSDSFQRVDFDKDLVDLGLSVIAAKDVIACFKQDQMAEAAIFWDIENLSIPAGLSAAHAVDRINIGLRSYGLMRSAIKIYGSLGLVSERKRSELRQSGCEWPDLPQDGKKDQCDKVMIADVLLWAMDHPPPAKIILMCGDKDLSYLIARLCSRGYFIVLVHNRLSVDRLKRVASFTIPWELLMKDKDEVGTDTEREDSKYDGNIGVKDHHQTDGITIPTSSSSSSYSSSTANRSSSSSPPKPKPTTLPWKKPAPFVKGNSLGSIQISVGDDNVESVSVSGGTPEEQTRTFASGVIQLVEILRDAERRRLQKPFGTRKDGWHSAATLGDHLARTYPPVRQMYQTSFNPLFDLAVSEGIVESRMEAGGARDLHRFLKLALTLPPVRAEASEGGGGLPVLTTTTTTATTNLPAAAPLAAATPLPLTKAKAPVAGVYGSPRLAPTVPPSTPAAAPLDSELPPVHSLPSTSAPRSVSPTCPK